EPQLILKPALECISRWLPTLPRTQGWGTLFRGGYPGKNQEGGPPAQVGSTKREKNPAALAVVVPGARSARAADRPHVAASLRSKRFRDQGGSLFSNLSLQGHFRRRRQRQPVFPGRHSFRRSFFGSEWQLPIRLLRAAGGDLFRRGRDGRAALSR